MTQANKFSRKTAVLYISIFLLLLILVIKGSVVGAVKEQEAVNAPNAPDAVTAVCEATADNGATVHSSADSQAVRDAIAVASDGDTVKVAGYCQGAGTGVLASIGVSITLQGGYTTTNWTTSNPVANPTTLDADQAGQVLYINNGADVTVDGLHLINGRAVAGMQRGGAIQVDFNVAGTALTVSNSRLENNYAGDFGGAIDNGAQSLVTIQNSVFISNTAANGGSGITINAGSYSGEALTITDSRFEDNKAQTGIGTGGAIGVWGGNISIANTSFISNTAITGGGIYALRGITVTNSSFISNTAATGNGSNGGGAVYLGSNGTNIISNSAFTGNLATDANNADGGAIHNDINSTLTLDSSSFTSNTVAGAVSEGGAIFNAGTLTVTTSAFSYNYSGGGGSSWGGGALLNTGTAAITNSTFYSNTAAHVGGAIAQRGTLTAVNSTFSDNSSGSGGSVNSVASTTHLINSIIANSVAGADCNGTPTTNTNNLIEDGSCSPAISGDPALGALENTGLGGTSVLPLLAGSPAIDAADSAAAPAADQRGVARPQGADADIGAYELDTTPPAAPVVTAPISGTVTADNPPTFVGTAEPGATITIKDGNGNTICTTTVDSNGDWTCTPASPLPYGSDNFAVTATDLSGNTSGSTNVALTISYIYFFPIVGKNS